MKHTIVSWNLLKLKTLAIEEIIDTKVNWKQNEKDKPNTPSIQL